LTPAEKMKRYRENLKTKPGKLTTMKQKDAARKRLSRQVEKMKEFAMTERQQAKVAERRKMIERDRKRNWRWRLSRAGTVQDIKYEESMTSLTTK
jgi:Skp family chaperone for outer membrane proteins